jgi:hypothetical protein
MHDRNRLLSNIGQSQAISLADPDAIVPEIEDYTEMLECVEPDDRLRACPNIDPGQIDAADFYGGSNGRHRRDDTRSKGKVQLRMDWRFAILFERYRENATWVAVNGNRSGTPLQATRLACRKG